MGCKAGGQRVMDGELEGWTDGGMDGGAVAGRGRLSGGVVPAPGEGVGGRWV